MTQEDIKFIFEEFIDRELIELDRLFLKSFMLDNYINTFSYRTSYAYNSITLTSITLINHIRIDI